MDGRSAVLVGEPGIGKSTLARAIGGGVGCRVRWGQALAPLGWVPYLPLARAVGRRLGGPVPAVIDLVVERVGSGLLALDDLQWADPDTLEILPRLAARVPVLGCLRSSDTRTTAVLEVVGQFAEVVAVEPLDDESAARIVRTVDPRATEADIARTVAAAGGNPLLLSLPSSARGRGVTEDRVLAIVGRASPPARRALARLWLLGADSPEANIDGLDELVRLGLVTIEGRMVGPRHARFGAAAVELLNHRSRIEVHRELASAATSEGARARHLLAAGDAASARRHALAAFELAATAHERADHLSVVARASGDDDPLLLRAVTELLAVVRLPEAREIISRYRPTSVEDRVRRHVLAAQTAYWTADFGAVEPELVAAEQIGFEGVSAEVEVTYRTVRARYLARVAWDPAAAIAEAERAIALAEANGLGLADACSALGAAALVVGDPRWRDALDRAVGAAMQEGLPGLGFVAADTLFMGELTRGDARRCLGLAEQMIESARSHGAVSTLMQFRKNRILALGTVFGDSRGVIDEAEDLLRARVNPRVREHTASQLAIAYADLGRDDEAVDTLGAIDGSEVVDPTSRAMLGYARAEVDWQAGRFEATIAAASACRDLPIGDFPTRVTAEPLRQWAALELGGDPGDVLAMPGFGNLAGAALESAGIIGIARDPTDPANERRLLEAAEAWAAFSRRLALRARWGAGQAALIGGRSDAAVQIIRPLEDELGTDGRIPLLRRVRRTLRAAGVTVPIVEGDPVGPLSGAQVATLELVARGLSTEMIARRLLVGTETVNAHLKTAMRRLRTPTRTAAALELVRLRGDRTAPAGTQTFTLIGGDAGAGWVGRSIRTAPSEPWSLTGQAFTASVAGADDVWRALLVALRGGSLGIVLASDLAAELRAELLTSLERIAPVLTVGESGPDPEVDPPLRRALEVLAQGGTIPIAAVAAGTSARTLYRRLGDLRTRFAIESNNELIARLVGGDRRVPNGG